MLPLLARRSALYAALGLGALLSLPALAAGWFNDDFVMRLLLDTGIEDYPLGPEQLYEFTPDEAPTAVVVEKGYLAWFTAPDLSMRFFRPLSSLSLALDTLLFGRSALLAHLHQLLWFLALVFVVSRLHRRVLRPSVAGLATLLYATGSLHAMSLAWVAARHVLVGGTFAALALLMHVGWRQSGERWRGVAAILALGVGMLSSEAALGVVVFVTLYEALARGDAPRRRVAAVVPTFALALLYLGFYAWGGWGVRGSGTYLSPFSDEARYVAAAAVRVPMLLGEAFGGVPSELAGMSPLAAPFVVWGLLSTMVVVLLIRLGPFGRRERWLLASTALSLAPVVGGFIGGRLLVVSGLGASALVATAIVRALVHVRGASRGWTPPHIGLALLLVLHCGISPLMRLAMGAGMMQLSRAEEAHARRMDLDACGEARLLYSLTGADPSNSLHLGSSLLFYTPERAERFDAIRALSMAVTTQRFVRVSERGFTLEILGERTVNPIEGVHYARPPEVGSVRHVGELTIRTTAGNDVGWTAAHFEVDRSLDDVCFGSWDGTTLQLWRAPAIGEARELAYLPGVMGM